MPMPDLDQQNAVMALTDRVMGAVNGNDGDVVLSALLSVLLRGAVAIPEARPSIIGSLQHALSIVQALGELPPEQAAQLARAMSESVHVLPGEAH